MYMFVDTLVYACGFIVHVIMYVYLHDVFVYIYLCACVHACTCVGSELQYHKRRKVTGDWEIKDPRSHRQMRHALFTETQVDAGRYPEHISTQPAQN